MQTIVYSKIDDLDIKLDLYVPSGKTGELPLVIFFHPGGLVQGSRRDALFPMWLKSACDEQGWLFISADYRLLAPFTISDIMDDLRALSSFVVVKDGLSAHLPSTTTVDTSRVILAGASAGSYLARLLAYEHLPGLRICAMLSLFGIGGDMLSDHYLKQHDKGFAIFGGQKKTKDGIEMLLAAPSEAQPLSDNPMGPAPAGGLVDQHRRGALCYWPLQEGFYLDVLTGRAGLSSQLAASTDREAAVPADLRWAFPQLANESQPPTYFIHGEKDSIALLAESMTIYDALRSGGIDAEIATVPGADHGLLIGGKPAPNLDIVYARAVAFLKKHMVR